jgi:hypothetical protein
LRTGKQLAGGVLQRIEAVFIDALALQRIETRTKLCKPGIADGDARLREDLQDVRGVDREAANNASSSDNKLFVRNFKMMSFEIAGK